MNVSPHFNRLIEDVEDFRATPYDDGAGYLTIGFGHRIHPTERFTSISREEARAILKQDTELAVLAVNRYVQVPLKQEQFDALVSFVYNVGVGAFAKSTLVRKLNAQHCCAVPDELRRWRFAGGRPLRGLMRRREKEIAMYVGENPYGG